MDRFKVGKDDVKFGLANEGVIVLFHGDNGGQEFYEDDANRLLIMRLKRPGEYWHPYGKIDSKNNLVLLTDIERQRKAPRGTSIVVGSDKLDEVIAMVQQQYGITAVVSDSVTWAFDPRHEHGMPMRLVPAKVTK